MNSSIRRSLTHSRYWRQAVTDDEGRILYQTGKRRDREEQVAILSVYPHLHLPDHAVLHYLLSRILRRFYVGAGWRYAAVLPHDRGVYHRDFCPDLSLLYEFVSD